MAVDFITYIVLLLFDNFTADAFMESALMLISGFEFNDLPEAMVNYVYENMGYKITSIQLFDYAERVQANDDYDVEVIYNYSANVVINDTFIIQVHGNKDESTIDGICHSSECYWNTEENQDNAYDNIENDIIIPYLENEGFENNIWWLEEHATEVMNPENAQYRK